MGFIFPLATLLRLREIGADREERLLGQIVGQITLTTQTMVDLEEKRREELRRRESLLINLRSAAEIILSYEQESSFKDMQKACQEQLDKLETLRLQQLKVYQMAYQSKELLAGIKEDQRKLFLKASLKKEQGIMDDNFSSRRSLR